MTMFAADPVDLLKTIEAQAESQDALIQRAIDALADMKAGTDTLEALTRRQIDIKLSRSSFIVEAAALRLELETGAPLRQALGLVA